MSSLKHAQDFNLFATPCIRFSHPHSSHRTASHWIHVAIQPPSTPSVCGCLLILERTPLLDSTLLYYALLCSAPLIHHDTPQHSTTQCNTAQQCYSLHCSLPFLSWCHAIPSHPIPSHPILPSPTNQPALVCPYSSPSSCHGMKWKHCLPRHSSKLSVEYEARLAHKRNDASAVYGW